VFVVALAAGTLAAAQQPPAKPPAAPPSAPAPATQPPASPTPAAGQPPAVPAAPLPAVPASRKFTSDSGVMFSLIKADKTADFEAVLARVKEALAKSQDPKRKQQALSWRVLKGLEAGPGGSVVYMWLLDPAVKDEDYSITTILAEAFPNEAQDLWAKYTACFVSGQTMLNLQQVLNMGPAGTVTVAK
jgi:pyruvate/2-oxoglutarate dehydrogenase complex dihydrolipoamide acyltransferase (E2) component